MIDHYFEQPYWIVDILPAQVPANFPGQYAAAEQYYLREPQITDIRRKYADLLIKLNCYYDVQVSCSFAVGERDDLWDSDDVNDPAGGSSDDPAGDSAAADGAWLENPEPAELARMLQALKPFSADASPAARQPEKPARGLPSGRASRICVLIEKEHTLAVLNADDTYMTVFSPSAGVLEMFRRLAAAEGLFVWQPRENNLPPGELV